MGKFLGSFASLFQQGKIGRLGQVPRAHQADLGRSQLDDVVRFEEVISAGGELAQIHPRAVHTPGVAQENLVRVRPQLDPGVVVTIEPGLYYPERGLGVRLEDTVWFRPDGEIEVCCE